MESRNPRLIFLIYADRKILRISYFPNITDGHFVSMRRKKIPAQFDFTFSMSFHFRIDTSKIFVRIRHFSVKIMKKLGTM